MGSDSHLPGIHQIFFFTTLSFTVGMCMAHALLLCVCHLGKFCIHKDCNKRSAKPPFSFKHQMQITRIRIESYFAPIVSPGAAGDAGL